MNILVTGGAGFIGSHLVDALIKRGDRVSVLDNLAGRVHPERAWPTHLDATAKRIRGDVEDREDWIPALTNIDAVVHLAAYQDYQADFSRFARVNDAGTALLYQLLVEMGQRVNRVVVASSQAVYGEGAHLCTAHGRQYPSSRPSEQLAHGHWDLKCQICAGPLKPTASSETEVGPTNAYAISKLASESYALAIGSRHDIPTTALRFSIIQGPRQSPANAYSGVLRSFVGHIQHGRAPVVFEDGHQLRDYTHIRDAVSAILIALEHPSAIGQVFNVGGGTRTSVKAYAEAVLNALGSTFEPDISGRYRVGDTRHVWSDTARLKALGWAPEGTLERIVRDYVEWITDSEQTTDWSAQALARMESSGTVRHAVVSNPSTSPDQTHSTS